MLDIERETGAARICRDINLHQLDGAAQLSGLADLGDGAALRWHPDGRRLLISARSPGVVFVLSVDGDQITLLGQVNCPGAMPRDAAFSPCGGWLLIAEQSGHRITSHRLLPDGVEAPATDELATGSPVCLAFAVAAAPAAQRA